MADPRPQFAAFTAADADRPNRAVPKPDVANQDVPNLEFTVALLTPPGRGAVATLAVFGPNVAELVAPLFQSASGKPLGAAPLGRVVYGRWQTSGEDVVVCRIDERRLEVHCHGGCAAAVEIVASLAAIGAREQCWQDWVAREEPDPLAAAARVELATAGAERAAAVLLDQYHGALRGAIDEILELLDRGAVAESRSALDRLIALAPLGAHLSTPWTVMLAGPPNVGKSSLMNAILGYERAIVFDAPGTTRDLLRGSTALAGWPFEFWDAAGLRETLDHIEAAGVAKAQEGSARADLVAIVFDAEAPWTPSDEALLAALPDALLVVNKCDLISESDRPASEQGITASQFLPNALRVSARTGEGLHALCQAIVSRLVPEEPALGTAVPFTAAQRSDLGIAAALAADGQMAAAAELLRRGPAWRLG